MNAKDKNVENSLPDNELVIKNPFASEKPLSDKKTLSEEDVKGQATDKPAIS